MMTTAFSQGGEKMSQRFEGVLLSDIGVRYGGIATAKDAASAVTFASGKRFPNNLGRKRISMLRTLFLCVGVAVLLFSSSSSFAVDWPRYRGPNMNNISAEAGELAPWTSTAPPRELWRA